MAEQGDVIRVTIIIEIPTSTIGNLVYYLRQVNAATTDDEVVANDVADIIEGDFSDHLAGIISDDVSWTRADFALLDTVTGDFNTFAQIPLVGADGTSIATYDTSVTAGLVKFFTNVAKRQGRKYLPGIISTNLVFDEFNGTATAAMGAWGLDFCDTYTADGVSFNPGVYSATLGFKAFSGDVEVNDIASHQTRRKPGVGI